MVFVLIYNIAELIRTVFRHSTDRAADTFVILCTVNFGQSTVIGGFYDVVSAYGSKYFTVYNYITYSLTCQIFLYTFLKDCESYPKNTVRICKKWIENTNELFLIKANIRRIPMNIVLIVVPLASIIFSLFSGTMQETSGAILEKSGEAVELVISICGVMCFWSGLMRVAERAGLTEKLSRLISPVVVLLFRGIKRGGKAAGLITMNLAANILGLGNASTPLGIAAMKAIAEENGAENNSATDDMIMLAVLNTASLQIIPATAGALRLANGVSEPFDILPCVWVVSLYSAAVAVIAAKIMGRVSRRRKP